MFFHAHADSVVDCLASSLGIELQTLNPKEPKMCRKNGSNLSLIASHDPCIALKPHELLTHTGYMNILFGKQRQNKKKKKTTTPKALLAIQACAGSDTSSLVSSSGSFSAFWALLPCLPFLKGPRRGVVKAPLSPKS